MGVLLCSRRKVIPRLQEDLIYLEFLFCTFCTVRALLSTFCTEPLHFWLICRAGKPVHHSTVFELSTVGFKLILVVLVSLSCFVEFESFLRALDEKLWAIPQLKLEKCFIFRDVSSAYFRMRQKHQKDGGYVSDSIVPYDLIWKTGASLLALLEHA